MEIKLADELSQEIKLADELSLGITLEHERTRLQTQPGGR